MLKVNVRTKSAGESIEKEEDSSLVPEEAMEQFEA